MWVLDEEVPDLIPGGDNMRNEHFYIGFGLGVLGSVPN